MAGITLEQAREQLQNWLNASAAVAQNVEYRIGTRLYKRADADQILKQVEYWNRLVTSLEAQASGARGLRITYGVPLS